MDQIDTPDLTLQLPRDLYYQIIHTLRASLPLPISDSVADQVHRDHAAITEVACLLPANGEEAVLAAQFVAASAQALDCLRLARGLPRNIELAMRCSAQAAAMMRQARGARALLLRVQAERHKREANAKALDAANLQEYVTVQLMADALPPPPTAQAPTAQASSAEPPSAEPAPRISFHATESHTQIPGMLLRSSRRSALLDTTLHTQIPGISELPRRDNTLTDMTAV